MAAIGCEEQAEAVALRANGDESSAPLDGLLTTTLASAVIAHPSSTRAREEGATNVSNARTDEKKALMRMQ